MEETVVVFENKDQFEKNVSEAMSQIARILIDIFDPRKEQTYLFEEFPVNQENKQEKIKEMTSHQPGGVPVVIDQIGFDLIFANNYLKKIKYNDQDLKDNWLKAAIEKAKKSIEDCFTTEVLSVASDRLVDLMVVLKQMDIEKEKPKETIARGDWVTKKKWLSNDLQFYFAIQENRITKKVRLKSNEYDAISSKFDLYQNTCEAADVWEIKHELKAMKKLRKHVNKKQFHRYLLTGILIEKSKLSGLTYIFRKLRPTLVFRTSQKKKVFLTALCHHPVAYYQYSWAGALVPTDDIISHLLMMRADEHCFWKKSIQHKLKEIQSDF